MLPPEEADCRLVGYTSRTKKRQLNKEDFLGKVCPVWLDPGGTFEEEIHLLK